MMQLSTIYWDPNRVAFTIPYLNHPVVWYGILFALGFLLAYLIGVHVFLFEIFSKSPFKADDIQNKEKLVRLFERYPKLFKGKNQDDILPLLNKYIKVKILPLKFFSHRILDVRKVAMKLADQLTTYLVVGLLAGARLGYVFFYGWPAFKADPLEIFKIWEGGLSSHGACIGILIALTLFVRKKAKEKVSFSFLHILDMIAIFCGVIACCIRTGNFVNQEIVGTPSNLPWAVIFAHPFGGEAPVARHPVQLYEAFFYLTLAVVSYFLWKKNKVKMGTGQMTGIVLAALFTFRFLIEFLKEHQGLMLTPDSSFQMGQILSLPFVLLGLILIFRPKWQQYKKSPL